VHLAKSREAKTKQQRKTQSMLLMSGSITNSCAYLRYKKPPPQQPHTHTHTHTHTLSVCLSVCLSLKKSECLHVLERLDTIMGGLVALEMGFSCVRMSATSILANKRFLSTIKKERRVEFEELLFFYMSPRWAE
jgi:hypothetical protein